MTRMKVLFVFPILIYLLTVNASVYETEDAIIIEVNGLYFLKCIIFYSHYLKGSILCNKNAIKFYNQNEIELNAAIKLAEFCFVR